MDGAGGLRIFKDITLSGIKKVFMTVTILVTIWTFNSFNVIFMLTEGGPMRSTETLIMKIYQEAFSRFNIGLAASLSIFTVIILMILTSFYIKGFKENES